MPLEFGWRDEMHDEEDNVGMEVSHKKETDTAGNNAEEFSFIIATDATSEAISNLHMETNY